MKEILKRKLYEQMLNWKNHHAPNYALFIKGARRVGKTTLATVFGQQEYRSYILIDLRTASKTTKHFIENNIRDLNLFFNYLQQEYETKLYYRESLIVFDEIQLFPKAREALKTLIEDGRYDYIETGSLAGIVKSTQENKILIPSEEHSLELHPLDFEEFLWAIGDNVSVDVLDDYYNKKKALNEMYQNMLIKFRKYMCVGGMPQAVVEYAKSEDFNTVNFIKNKILDLYREDVKSQKQENSIYIENVLDNIPAQLSRHGVQDAKIFRINQVNSKARMREYAGPLNWLNDAMIINIARSCSDPNVALALTYSLDYFKCYMEDTGLLINLSFNNANYIDNKIYGALLFDKLHINEGMFIENIVAQQLTAKGYKPTFYVSYDENSKIINEVDFLIQKGNKICPIEVRSGKSKSFKSLDKFKKKFTNRVGQQIILYEGDLKIADNKIFLPYFMAHLL